jgi:hypothetical protein
MNQISLLSTSSSTAAAGTSPVGTAAGCGAAHFDRSQHRLAHRSAAPLLQGHTRNKHLVRSPWEGMQPPSPANAGLLYTRNVFTGGPARWPGLQPTSSPGPTLCLLVCWVILVPTTRHLGTVCPSTVACLKGCGLSWHHSQPRGHHSWKAGNWARTARPAHTRGRGGGGCDRSNGSHRSAWGTLGGGGRRGGERRGVDGTIMPRGDSVCWATGWSDITTQQL